MQMAEYMDFGNNSPLLRKLAIFAVYFADFMALGLECSSTVMPLVVNIRTTCCEASQEGQIPICQIPKIALRTQNSE